MKSGTTFQHKKKMLIEANKYIRQSKYILNKQKPKINVQKKQTKQVAVSISV